MLLVLHYQLPRAQCCSVHSVASVTTPRHPLHILLFRLSMLCSAWPRRHLLHYIAPVRIFFIKKNKNWVVQCTNCTQEKAWSCRHRFHLCCSFSYHFSTSLCHVVDNKSKDAVSGSACSEPIAVLHDLCLSVSLHPILHSPYIARTLDSINTIFEWSRQTIITSRYADKNIPLIHYIYLYIIYIN